MSTMNTECLPAPSPLMGEGRGEGELLTNAKRLRKEMTDAETKLWHALRAKRFAGYKFRRQVPMQKYIADFVCYEPKVIVELDGGQHVEQAAYDKVRDQFFVRQGFRVLRFWNDDMLQNTEAVLQAIFSALATPLPNPLPQGERGQKGASA